MIENIFFNKTGGIHTIMIFVRNVGVINIQLVAIYVNGNPQSSFNVGDLPSSLGVQAVVEFNISITTWTSGTVFTVLVATARGNEAVATARGP